MARKLSVVIFITLISMLLLLAENNAADIIKAPTPQPEPRKNNPMYGATEDCKGRCKTKCSKMAYKKPCMFLCQKCCAKCFCVPPGTYGNKQFCPCYND